MPDAHLTYDFDPRNPVLPTLGDDLAAGYKSWTGIGQNLRDSQVEVVAGGRNHQNLRMQKSRLVGVADLRDLVSQLVFPGSG